MTGTPLIQWANAVRDAQRRRKVRFWGSESFIRPRLSSEVFGDGGQLLGLEPMASRPDHFLVRIDSRQCIDNSDQWGDVLAGICSALESEFDDFDASYGLNWWTEEQMQFLPVKEAA